MAGEVDVSRGHQGREDLGINKTQSDNSIYALASRLLHTNPLSQFHTFISDPYRTTQTERYRFNFTNGLQFGRVMHAEPLYNWYKVQIGEGGQTIPCTAVGHGSFVNLGVRPSSIYGPNSSVLVFVPPGVMHGYIIGTVPQMQGEAAPNINDWIVQGSNVGAKRDKAHKLPLTKLFRQGGVRDFSNRRPVDGGAWEWGFCSESGIGILIDSFMAYLRVNEMCGLFLNFWDFHTRLAGMNLDIQSNVVHDIQREDEGENQRIIGQIVYPWEAVGCYKDGTEWTKEFPDDDVHFKLVKGKVDLPDGEEDLQPVHRFVEYGGYLGQPVMRMLMAPKKESGKRYFKDEDKDRGLWQEIISLDGAYTMRTAKSYYVGHRVIIPVPKRKRLQEDQKTGDDGRKGNYKFSSKFGGGEEHKVKDVKVEGEERHLRRVAGVLDLLSHNYNWKSLHPFHYHKEDYKLFQESELKGEPFDRVQDMLEFGELGSKDFMSYPTPKKIKIDHRYKEVDYFQRESFFCLHEDGSLQMACGYGSQISAVAGSLIFDCPGNIMFMAGKRVVMMGWDVVARAKNSMDFSATEKDVRFKAEQNMQFVAANSGTGGMLFDSKSNGTQQIYKDVYGEDVKASGIVFLAKKSQVAALAKDIYMRTGGGDIKPGNITLDATKGGKRVVLYGKNIDMHVSKAVRIWHQPSDESANPVSTHRFAQDYSIVSGKLIQEKGIIITKGGLIAKETIATAGTLAAEKSALIGESVAVGGAMAINGGVLAKAYVAEKGAPFVAPSDKGAGVEPPDISPLCDKAEEARMKHVDLGEPMFEANLKNPWYTQGRLGHNDTMTPMGFSFRDPPSSTTQYKTDQFKMPEPRWIEMVRLSMGTGGVAWTEKPVLYQGRQTYPFPGKKKWQEEETMLCYKKHEMFDEGPSNAKDRPGPYEDPKLADWEKKKPDGYFKTVL